MSDERSERIAKRAYELWEREGKPEGRHHEHWLDAERELEGGSTGEDRAGAGGSVLPASTGGGTPSSKGPGPLEEGKRGENLPL